MTLCVHFIYSTTQRQDGQLLSLPWALAVVFPPWVLAVVSLPWAMAVVLQSWALAVVSLQ